MKIADNVTELIGNTPMVRAKNLCPDGNIVLKLEYFNPGNSVKDRAAFQMIKDAIEKGLIDNETVLIEPTSGNTGIGLAMICAVMKLKIILTMPQTMSIERRMLLKAYGAEVILTDGKLGMKGAVDKAVELSKEYPKSFIPSQFDNPSNPKAHYIHTAEEIWKDTEGKVDIVVAGVGTGGTISGIGKKLKEKKSDIKMIAVEPFSSQVLAGFSPSSHKIQGIGANFVPKNYDNSVVDEIIPVKNEQAIFIAKELGIKEGILTGFSGGAATSAAIELSKRSKNKDKLIVTILPDFGERYLSTELYQCC